MRDETQALLEEISRKERILAAPEIAHPWWTDAEPASWKWATRIAVAFGIAGLVMGIVCSRVATGKEKACTTYSLRQVLADAPAVPWRHHHNAQCDVWISGAGLAEVTCDHQVVYRGFGSMDGSAFSAVELHETTPNDHDLARTAYLDGRNAWIGPFAHCHQGIRCGRLELHGLTR